MKINPDTAADLRDVYLSTFSLHSAHPADLVEPGRNSRYVRELLGTLVKADLLTKTEDGDGGDVWQVINPGTYDTHTEEDAIAVIDEFLGNTTSEKKDTKMTKTADTTVHDCYCGCGEKVPGKSFYRPGHDARHAGNLGRHVAATQTDVTNTDHYSDLPSERLVAKSMGIAVKALEKATAKAAKAEAKATKAGTVDANDDGTEAKEHGTVKVGKTEFAAVRYTATGKVEYFDGADTKAASKTATKTFTLG